MILCAGSLMAGMNVWTLSGLSDKTISCLAIDPSSLQLFMQEHIMEFFKTTDSGATWYLTGMGNHDTLALAISPSDPSTVYAATWGEGVFKSSDGGRNWKATGLANADIDALSIDPLTPSTVYAGSNSEGIYKTTNGGRTWGFTGLANHFIFALANDPFTSQLCMRVLHRKVHTKQLTAVKLGMRSIAALQSTVVNAMAVDPSAPSTVYAGTEVGVFRTEDGGGSWNAVSKLMSDPDVSSLGIDPSSPSTVYAGTFRAELYEGGVFK